MKYEELRELLQWTEQKIQEALSLLAAYDARLDLAEPPEAAEESAEPQAPSGA